MSVLHVAVWWAKGPSLVAQWWRIHLQCRRPGFDPWVRTIPWRKKQQPPLIFLLGKSTEKPVGYSPWNLRIRHDLVTEHEHTVCVCVCVCVYLYIGQLETGSEDDSSVFFLLETSNFALRLSNSLTRPTHIIGDNLLYLKSTDCRY